MLRQSRDAASGRLDTPKCRNFAFLIGYETGNWRLAEKAFREHRLQGRCPDCLRKAVEEAEKEQTYDWMGYVRTSSRTPHQQRSHRAKTISMLTMRAV